MPSLLRRSAASFFFGTGGIARVLFVLAAWLLSASIAHAKSAGCTNVPVSFPPAGTIVAAGQTATINTFAAGEVITFTQSAGPSGVVVKQGNGVTIAGPFAGPGTYLTTPITSGGVSAVTVTNPGASNVQLSAVCNAPASFTVTVLTDPATGTASNCTAGSTTDPSCSLRDAVAAANALSGAAATIFFSPAVVGTLTLAHGELDLSPNTVVNIAGPGANFLALSGNNVSSILALGASARATISGLTFTGGNSANTGGAINAASAALTINSCSFNANQAVNAGGAVSIGTGPLVIASSTFSGNAAGGSAGAVNIASGSATIVNSTFTANTAAVSGGAVQASGAALSLTNDTLTGNTASVNGGGLAVASGTTLNLGNTVIAGNTATVGYADTYPGIFPPFDNGGNYYSTAATAGASALNPMLLPLANYGGPLQTMLPLPLSPLLCQGSTAVATAAGFTLDARNNPRTTTYGATTCVDSGAVQSSYTLSFVQQPVNSLAGVTIAPSPTVQWKESSIAVAVAGQPILMTAATGALSGTTPQSTNASGIATFTDLSIATVPASETLKATFALSASPAVNATVTSSSFAVAAPVTVFAITALPSTVTAGSAIGFTVTALNGAATSTHYTGTITISSTQDSQLAFVGGSVMYTFTAADAGVHTFTVANGAIFKTAGSDTLTVTDTGNNVATTSGTITVNAAAPALLSAVSGSGQAAPIGGTFTAPLKANVTDIYGNPNSGVTVSFAGPASGAGIAPIHATAATGADGTASLTAIANATASATAYSVAASVAGIATPVNFTLTNTQAATHISVVQVAPQPVANGTGVNVPTTFVATLSDATQNSAGLPTGTVQFFAGTTPLGAPVNIVNALASLTTTFASTGNVSITAQYAGDNNFTGSSSTALVEVVAIPSYTISFNPASLTISGGGNATTTLTVTPAGNYTGTVSFACNGLVQYSACIFAPTLVALNGDNTVQHVSLTLYTLGPGNTSSIRPDRSSTLDAGLFWLPGIAFASLLLLRRRGLVKIPGLLALLLLASAMLGLGGCSTMHYYTPTGTDTVTVNATGIATPGSGSSNLNQTATLSLIVQ